MRHVSAFPAVNDIVVSVNQDPVQRSVYRGPGDDPRLTDEELMLRRTAWFHMYTAQQNVFASPGPDLYSCPCCGHPTLTERGGYEICGECGWEDDGQDDHDSEVIRGGPNGPVTQAKQGNYAIELRPVGGADEKPD
jgi:hypothetical protein